MVDAPNTDTPRSLQAGPVTTSPPHSHTRARLTTAALLALWLGATAFASPLTPVVAEIVVHIEFALGLDVSRGEGER